MALRGPRSRDRAIASLQYCTVLGREIWSNSTVQTAVGLPEYWTGYSNYYPRVLDGDSARVLVIGQRRGWRPGRGLSSKSGLLFSSFSGGTREGKFGDIIEIH